MILSLEIGSHLNGGHLGNIEYKYSVHIHFCSYAATVNYLLPRGETFVHLALTHILEIFKDFFACKFILAANHQLYPRKIQSLSGQQSTVEINSSNQQQQSTAAINSSNQQQQSSATINSSTQQQQSTAATNSSNQLSSYQQHLHNQRRPPLDITTVPSRGYVRLEVDLGIAAR